MEDTIAAIGTPGGQSAIGIVRVSGSKAEIISNRLFRSSRGANPLPSHRLVYGHIVDPSTGRVVDEVLATLMRSPKTYTREDVFEIQSHGGPAAVNCILELVLDAGARLAQPGEFTKRAFLNGRIDLTQAEAVIDVIRSTSATSLEISNRLVGGELRDRILAIRTKLEKLLTQVEVAIDFPEEDLESIAPQKTSIFMREEILAELTGLIETFKMGRLLREGVDIVIVGKPNVGKSSLLNCLLNQERAIVSPYPGTTRDSIEANFSLDGIPMRLVDTAGLRETDDEIEQMSLGVTRKRLAEADIALWVLDLSGDPDIMDDEVFKMLDKMPVIAAANKRDLVPEDRKEVFENRYEGVPMIAISALYEQGIDALKKGIRSKLELGELESYSGPIITRMRHNRAIQDCKKNLERALGNIENGMLIDLLAEDLRTALDKLGEVVGLVTSEDILDRIFSDFCIGK